MSFSDKITQGIFDNFNEMIGIIGQNIADALNNAYVNIGLFFVDTTAILVVIYIFFQCYKIFFLSGSDDKGFSKCIDGIYMSGGIYYTLKVLGKYLATFIIN